MTEQNVAWQEKKSLHERNRYMLENEIWWDVSFEICPPEGSTVVLVRAHKVFLVAASPVFEAMFCGRMAEARPDLAMSRFQILTKTPSKKCWGLNVNLLRLLHETRSFICSMKCVILSWMSLVYWPRVSWFFCRSMLCISAAYAVMPCLSVLSVWHVREFCQNE